MWAREKYFFKKHHQSVGSLINLLEHLGSRPHQELVTQEPHFLSHHLLSPRVCVSRKMGSGAQLGLEPGPSR